MPATLLLLMVLVVVAASTIAYVFTGRRPAQPGRVVENAGPYRGVRILRDHDEIVDASRRTAEREYRLAAEIERRAGHFSRLTDDGKHVG